MPCYEVRLTSVEFKAQHVELLLTALDRLQLKYEFRNQQVRLIGSGLMIDLDAKTAYYREGAVREASLLNGIKRAYSAVVIEAAATKKKWFIKQLGANKMALRKV